jgi:hypothetical protein
MKSRIATLLQWFIPVALLSVLLLAVATGWLPRMVARMYIRADTRYFEANREYFLTLAADVEQVDCGDSDSCVWSGKSPVALVCQRETTSITVPSPASGNSFIYLPDATDPPVLGGTCGRLIYCNAQLDGQWYICDGTSADNAEWTPEQRATQGY